MRVLVVLCLALAFVAAQEDEVVSPGAPDTTSGCIREAIRSGIDENKKDFGELLEQLSSKEEMGGFADKIAAEYDLLQQKMDEATRTVLADRETCEKDNQQAVFKRHCDSLARISFLGKGHGLLGDLDFNGIKIIYEARQKFAVGDIQRLQQFFRDRGIVKNLRKAAACIGSRN